ncbi:MAG: type II toxin-antitoxin system YoeB family toxin [Synergistaceae bacterium]|nr:type II toxin-antitoxin system YoeB family toxin [Synergistaceae bacterium]
MIKIGKPEPLKEELSGYWSVQIDEKTDEARTQWIHVKYLPKTHPDASRASRRIKTNPDKSRRIHTHPYASKGNLKPIVWGRSYSYKEKLS